MTPPPPSPAAPVGATVLPGAAETQLVDYLTRLDRHRTDRRAVLIQLSGLQPINRREHHLRAASSPFAPLVNVQNAQAFNLTNADLMVVYKAAVQDAVEAAIVKLRFMFSDDPMILKEETSTLSFCTWYSLIEDYTEVMDLARGRLDEIMELQRRAKVRAEPAAPDKRSRGVPLTPDLLTKAEAALDQADLANLMRRQAVCALVGQSSPQPVFNELFISILELRQALMPQVNVASSPWLFQQLTETLDRRVLSLLNKHDDRTLESDISINLNVSTILSPEFQKFDDNVRPGTRGTIVLELQKIDIFADLGAYLFARDFARDRGYRICIDGLTYAMLPYVDRERLGADLIKLVWEPSLADEAGGQSQAIRRIGPSRIVLCRCDSPAAVDYGQSVGLSLFQGRHVEMLLQTDLRRRGKARPR